MKNEQLKYAGLPPWQQNIFSSTMAATGRQLKQSVNVFQSLMLYLRLPNCEVRERVKSCNNA